MRIWHQSFTDLEMSPIYARTLAKHLGRVVESDTSVTVHGLKPGTYYDGIAPIDAIRYRYIEFLNLSQIIEAAVTAQGEGYDAFAIGCFFDPGLHEARSIVDIPVVGLAETSMILACAVGRKFGLITLNWDQKARYDEIIQSYGLHTRFAVAVPLDPPIDEYVLEGTHAEGSAIEASFRRACQAVLEGGADVIIPADGVLNEFIWARGIRQHREATVLDSVGSMLKFAEFMVGAKEDVGLAVSRVSYCARPDEELTAHARAVAGSRPIAEEEFSGPLVDPVGFEC